MRNWTRSGVALAASAVLIAVCGGAQAQNAAGDWHGTLNFVGGFTGQIAVTLKAKAGGRYEGSYVRPKVVYPLDEAKVDKGTLSFSVPAIHASYSGRWDEARKAWVGEWTQPPQPTESNPSPPSVPPFPLVLTAGKP